MPVELDAGHSTEAEPGSSDSGAERASDGGSATEVVDSDPTLPPSSSMPEPSTQTVPDSGLPPAGARLVPWALPQQVGSPLGGVSSIGHYDFDGDGRYDVLAGGYGAGQVVWFSGDATDTEAHIVEANVSSTWFSKGADLDGDGDVDVVVGSYGGQLAWYRNDGEGTFEPTVVDEGVVGPWLALEDLTGDGLVDILAGPDGGTEVYLYQGTGEGFSSRETIVSGVGAVAGMLVRDVNGDAFPDLVVGAGSDNEVVWYLNDGNGQWPRAGSAGGGAYVGILGQTDVDGDGRRDLLTIEYSDDRLAWYPATDTGYGTRQSVPLDLPGVYALTAADFDGDGLDDLAVGTFSGASSSLLWLKNGGGGTWASSALVSVGMGQISSLDSFDHDRDGDPDLLVGSFSGSQVWRFDNRRGESATAVQLPAAGTYVGGQELWTLVHLGFPLEVRGEPELILQVGGREALAKFVRREGAAALWFVAQVLESDIDTDGVELNSDHIDLAGGAIDDAWGEPVDLSLPEVPRSDARVAGSAPYVLSVRRIHENPTASANVSFEVQFSEPVARRSVEDFVVHTTGDLANVEVTEVTGQGATAIVAVSTGTGSGVVELEIVPNSQLADGEGNALAFDFRGGEVYTLDRRPAYDITEYYTEAHGDIAAAFSEDSWAIQLHTDRTYEPGEVLIFGGPEALTERPTSEAFAFLGMDAGAPVYVWPAMGLAGVPELGVGGAGIGGGTFAAYQHLDPRVNAWGEWAHMTAVELRGPPDGALSVYTTDVIGEPVVWIATADGISEQDTVVFAAGSHQHFNFAFSKSGTYELDIVFSAHRERYGNGLRDDVADHRIESGVVTFYFGVDVPNGPAPHRVRSGVMRSCASHPYDLETGELLLTARHMDVITVETDCRDADLPVLRLSSSYNAGVGGGFTEHHAFEDVTLVAGPTTLFSDFPELGENQGGLAANPGDDAWLFPEVAPEGAESPWPGLQSYNVPLGVFEGDRVHLQLVASETPDDGRFQLFYSPQDPSSPFPIQMDTAEPRAPLEIPAGTHMHFNWLFTKPGLYHLTFRAVGTLLDGRNVESSDQMLRVWVGDGAQSPPNYPTQMGLQVQSGGGDDGSTRLSVSFVGDQTPITGDIEWMRQCVSYAQQPWILTPWQSLGLGNTWDVVPRGVPYESCEYRARVIGPGGTVLALTQSYVE